MADYVFKIILVGDCNVGKTNLLSRFCKNDFETNSKPTIGVELGVKTLKINNDNVKAQVWDTAGQERFKALTYSYYRGSSGAIIVYDITNKKSFENCLTWLKEVKKFDIPYIMLIGNKSDKNDERKVLKSEAYSFCEKNDLYFIETSALTNENVVLCFETLIKEIYKIFTKNIIKKEVVEKKEDFNKSSEIITIKPEPIKKKKCC
jgi:small GTP-binding protein